jgi:hypothetical protein
MTTETVLKQVRNRLGPLNGQAEQAVAEAVEIIRQMSEQPSSPITEDSFKGENPSLEEYESWSDEQQRRYLVEAKKNNAKWIETKLHELNAAWLIVVDGKIKAHGPALQTFPHEEEFEAFCKKIGKFPFVIFSPRIFFIEESASWHSTKLSNDAYPTLHLNLKTATAETILDADFDTGAVDSYFDLDLLVQRGLIKVKKIDIKDESSHLGRSFDYVTKSIWMELRDKNGQSRQERVYGICVENWRHSPFVAINPNRTALVGRGTMLKLQPMVGLDFANRQTEVEYRQVPTS